MTRLSVLRRIFALVLICLVFSIGVTRAVTARTAGSPPRMWLQAPSLLDASLAPPDPLYTVSGTVRDWAGAPMQNAIIQTGWGDPSWAVTWTDEAGAYSLSLRAGTYHISASQSGLPGPPSRTVTVPPSVAGVDFIFPQHYTIRGSVRDWDGTPMAGIQMYAQNGGSTTAKTTADASGAYTLTVIAGLYQVSAGKYPLPAPATQFVIVPPDVAGIDFTFPLRYTIAGAVHDHTGTPVAGAQVSTAWDDPISAYGSTDDDGRYRLTVIAGAYHLAATAPGLIRPVTRTLAVPPAATAIDFNLPERYQVSGTVRDWEGAPLADASVTAVVGQKYYDVASSLTDAAGVYTLTVAAATYNIFASKEGYLSPSPQEITVPPARSDVDLTFLRPYTIRGTVRDQDGTPMADVTMSARQNYWGMAYGRTDVAGAYTLTVAAGAYSIVADKYPLPGPIAQAVNVPPDATAVDFTFPQRYTIRGVVRYYDGAPVDGARVGPKTGDRTSNLPVTQSDATGAYTLTVVAGVYNVGVSKDSLQAPPDRLVTVPPDADAVDFTLPQHYTVTGVLHDWTGAAVSYAQVSALTANDKTAASAQTDGAGSFTLLLNAGTYRLRGHRIWQPDAPEQVVTVPPSAECLDLILPRPYMISGTVRDHTGALVKNADVFIKKGGEDGAAARTAGDGTYTLLAAAGKWVVYLELNGYLTPATQSVEVPPNAAGVDFILPGPPQFDTISGAVHDQYGNPVEGAKIYGGASTGITAADGTYTITARSDVTSSYIEAYKSGYKTSGMVLVPARPVATAVNFVLRAEDGMIFGRVLDPAGRPVAGARISAWDVICPSRGSDSTTSDASGAYTLTVPIGLYTVYPFANGYISAVPQEIVLQANGGHAAVQVDFTLEPAPFFISGRVLSSAGQPVADAMAQAHTCDFSFWARGDVTGAYTLPVSAGIYALSAWEISPPPPSIAGQDATASVPGIAGAVKSSSSAAAGSPGLVSVPPSITGVDIVIPPSPSSVLHYAVRGRVTDDQGWPVEGAYVSSAWRGAEYSYEFDSQLSGADGIFVLELPAGAYRISAYKAGYARPAPRSVTVPPEQIGMDLVLPRAPENVAVTVSGVVRDAQGQPFPYAYICTETVGADNWGIDACSQVYYDGSYALSLERGTYRLSAHDAYGCSAPSEKREMAVLSALTEQDFTLRPPDQLVSGRVTDALGRPICGAKVDTGVETLKRATTDGWGLYDLSLPAGTYTLTAAKSGYGRGADQVVTLPPRGAAVDFVLPLPANVIQGTARDTAGRGVAGTTVEVNGSAALDPAATGADGSYTVYVPDGDWRVTANRPGYAAFPSLRSVRLPPSPAEADFVLVADAEVRRLYLPVLWR